MKSHYLLLLGACTALSVLLSGCDKTSSAAAPSTTVKRAELQVTPQEAHSPRAPEFSETTDPTNLGHLFLGQVRAVGYGLDMKVDQNVMLLVTGALADEVGGPITQESLRDTFKKAEIVRLENGTGVWNGRTLPAAIATVAISTINRAAGTYGHICLQFGGLKDDEFGYIRSPAYLYCDQPQKSGQADLLGWKQKAQFRAANSHQFSN